MHPDLICVGDQVTLDVEREAREWGYNPPYPDGTEAIVVGFTQIVYTEQQAKATGKQPGQHNNTCWPVVQLPNGSVIKENHSRLKLKDQEEYERRVRGLKQTNKMINYLLANERVT